MNKLLIITGPTATGKTSLGLKLAKEFNGEIISADSRQVYKYMDIGTGKALDHFEWGIDLIEPDQQFSVSDWVNYTMGVIRGIWERDELPIIIGGTGQYIKELLTPSETLHIPPNYELRSKNYKVGELQEMLQKIDFRKWKNMNCSDRSNSRRLVRAIEVAMYIMHNGRDIKHTSCLVDANWLIVGLTAPMECLYGRIDKRVDERLVRGMAAERQKLAKYKLPETIGYHHETAQEWKNKEHAYAKRQMAYLKKYLPGIQWVDITKQDKLWPIIKNIVNTWLRVRK